MEGGYISFNRQFDVHSPFLDGHKCLLFSTYQSLIHAAVPNILVPRTPSVSVPPHRPTVEHRWEDNCKGLTVKEIIGDSIPLDRSWSGLGF